MIVNAADEEEEVSGTIHAKQETSISAAAPDCRFVALLLKHMMGGGGGQKRFRARSARAPVGQSAWLVWIFLTKRWLVSISSASELTYHINPPAWFRFSSALLKTFLFFK